MSSPNAVFKRIIQYRICLERDVEHGVVSHASSVAVDRIFRSLSADLEYAQYELAGLVGPGGAFRQHFVGGYAQLARTMFLAMYRDDDSGRLARLAHSLEAEARVLMEQLRIRIESAA